MISPYFAAWILQFLLAPLVDGLGARGLGHSAAAGIVYAGAFALLVGLLIWLAPPLVTQFHDFAGWLLQQSQKGIPSLIASVDRVIQDHAPASLRPQLLAAVKNIGDQAQEQSRNVSKGALSAAATIGSRVALQTFDLLSSGATVLFQLCIAVQLVIANVVGPRVLSESVGVNTLLTFGALLVGGKLGGVLGAFFAIPLHATHASSSITARAFPLRSHFLAAPCHSSGRRNAPGVTHQVRVESGRKSTMANTQQATKRAEGRASTGFTAEERAAMRERAREVKAAQGKADDERDCLAKIAEMQGSDRAMAERLHALIAAAAPELAPKTWYGMPAYAKDGAIVCFFKSALKYNTRYATLGFTDKANLDEGSMWPTDFALKDLRADDEARISALVKQAVS